MSTYCTYLKNYPSICSSTVTASTLLFSFCMLSPLLVYLITEFPKAFTFFFVPFLVPMDRCVAFLGFFVFISFGFKLELNCFFALQ